MTRTVQSFNPATGELIREYPQAELGECLDIIDKSAQAARAWKTVPPEDRTAPAGRLADLLEQGRDHHAALITRETGKPIRESRQEIDDAAALCRYYARRAPALLADQPVEAGFQSSLIRHRPLGIVFGIMPWNFPFLQPLRPAIPALLAGNTFLLKPAHSTPDCALTLEALFREAGFPENAFRTLLTNADNGAVALAHPAVQGVAFTGSSATGKQVAALAGSQIKRTVLELGGSDPAIVLEDADLEAAADGILAGKLIFGGQHCIAVKRILVARAVSDELCALLVQRFQQIPPGDPLLEETRLGPLGVAAQRDAVHTQVEASHQAGAKVLCGGEIPHSPGFHYPLTLLSAVQPNMPVFAEEVFGPVAALVSFDSDDEAITLANQTPYGLGASIYSRDPQRSQIIADRLETGMIYLNGPVRSCLELPFGGVKSSGIGRELGPDGLYAFTNRQVLVRP